MIQTHDPLAQEQNIQNILLRLDLLAHLINDPDQAHIRFHEDELAAGIERLALGNNALRSILGTADKICTRLMCMLRKFLERYFADSAGASYEEGHEAGRKSGRDKGIGCLDLKKRNHCC